MKVLIVAKTRMGSGACIGAIDPDGRSLRLIAADQDWNEDFNQEYEVGEVWEIEAEPIAHRPPPHVEDVLVRATEKLGKRNKLVADIERLMPPREGGPEALFEGLTKTTSAGAMYIAERHGVPAFSTMFWRPDQPLSLDTGSKRLRYRYPTEDGGRTLTFVGYQEPIETIPAGTLLRVSLAHWWRPDDMPDGELRCHVQLSGWFLDGEAAPATGLARRTEPEPAESLDLDGARRTLQRVFGYDDFRPNQAEVIASLLGGADTLAVMPTGSGKSLCYQLPALLFPGLTVVVSPLISLMHDQVQQLQELGIAAAALNSAIPYPDYLATTARIRSGKVKLLYAAPETLLRPETLVLLQQCRVDCLTIDEAHCISEWGHDFRPEYRQLTDLRDRLSGAVVLATTATATERVRQDIKRSLGVGDAAEFVASFNRENLFLEVSSKADSFKQTLDFLGRHRDESGIIYCSTRATVDWLAEALAAVGWSALPYHAGLPADERAHNQKQFSHDNVQILVATIAFGMGINKSNVRFIVHYDLPKNLESYYQQIGRAGRDGLRADCLLLYSPGDAQTIYRFIDQGAADQRPGAMARLQAMLAYAETAQCRRQPLLTYFGEQYDAANCGYCDNCLAAAEPTEDLTVPAQKFLSAVLRTGTQFGAGHIADVLRGSLSKRVVARGHDRLPTHGAGREYSKAEWQALSRQLVEHDLLARDMEHGSLKLTDRGRAVLRGEPFHGVAPAAPRAGGSGPAEVEYDRNLFERLRIKRKELADERSVPAFVIFSDRSLVDMATYFPQTEDSFGRMNGVGAHKLAAHGATFMRLIIDYCRERGIQEIVKPGARPVDGESARAARVQFAVAELGRGRSPAEIATALGLKESTVHQFFWDEIVAGRKLHFGGDLRQFSRLPADQQERVIEAFSSLGMERLKPVFDAMDGAVDYDELRLMWLWLMLARQESEAGQGVE